MAAEHPEKVVRLRRLISSWREENAHIRQAIGEASEVLAPEIAERLRALGYL